MMMPTGGLRNGDLWVISFIGKDRPGLLNALLSYPAKKKVNIVDLQQRVLQGHFFMTLVADFSNAITTQKEIETYLLEITDPLGIQVSFLPMEQYRGNHGPEKNLHVVTILARDRIGIIHDVAGAAAKAGINIERTRVTARGNLISIEFLMDFTDHDEEGCRALLRSNCESLGLDLVVQRLDKFQKEKRLIVFDMDMTIVDFETINRLASVVGATEEVRTITEKAMNGEMEFSEALRQRVRLLKGMPLSSLEEIARDLTLTPGSAELIHHLKEVGYKIALISGGFTYFTDVLKERLGFDYTFANELEIKDGVLTGEVKGQIIDAKEKGNIVNELARREGISPDNIVAVGDGANDCLMIQNAGLGVAFNAKEILKKVSDGSLSSNNLIGLLNVLGIADKSDGKGLHLED